MGFTHHGVPKQEAHRCADHQHHKSAHGAGSVLVFVVQIKGGGHPAEQHEHLVQVAHGNVANVGADLVALIPAHHGAHQRQRHRHPGDARAQQLEGLTGAGQHAHPVKQRAHEEQHAHPQNGRLAGDEVLQHEHVVGAR